jgi:tRNA(Ile)-lysidine synthase
VSVGGTDRLLQTAEDAFSWTTVDRLAVAVSGGSDSLAALHLMVRASAKRGWQVQAVTVDHRLRPEAADEAAFVAEVCVGLGVPHETLVWKHGVIAGNLMDQARRARYGLLAEWARRQGIGHVVLGHTADDQAETFLMGLARSAGLDGLSGMRHAWPVGDVVFARPFLETTRQHLRDFLTRDGCKWIDDPTNDDEDYARIKARRALAKLRPLGVTIEGLGRVVENLDMARSVVHAATFRAAKEVVQEQAGTLSFDRPAFEALQQELQRRILNAGLNWVSGAEYSSRASAVHRVQRAVMTGKHSTLSGCRIRVTADHIRIMREPKAVATVECPTDQPWDNRWHLTGPHGTDLTIRALGDGIRSLPNWRATQLSRDTLVVSPAVWRGDTLIAAPLAGFSAGWTAKIAQSFDAFILSH